MTQNRELTFAQQAISNRVAQKNATSNLNRWAQKALKSKHPNIVRIKFSKTKEMPAQDGLDVRVEHDGKDISMGLLLKSNRIYVQGNLFRMDSKTKKLAQRYNRKLACRDWVDNNFHLIVGGAAIVMIFFLVRHALKHDEWINEKVDAYKETLSPDYKQMEQQVEDYRKAMHRAYYKRNR